MVCAFQKKNYHEWHELTNTTNKLMKFVSFVLFVAFVFKIPDFGKANLSQIRHLE